MKLLDSNAAPRLAVLCLLLGGGPGAARAQMNPELGLGGDESEPAAGGSGSATVSVTEGEGDSSAGWGAAARDDEEPAPRERDDEASEARDDESRIEAFRLGLALRLFEFESRRASVDIPGGGSADQDTKNFSFGAFPSQLGLNLGFGFAERFVVGARLQLAIATGSRISFTGVETDTSGLGLGFLPYFEVAFNPRDTVVWDAYALLGVRSFSADSAALESSQTVFVMGLGLGTHIFFADGASIDPAFELTYSVGGGSETAIDPVTGTRSTTDFGVGGLVLGLELGMSFWL